ncbi:MAG: DUF2785 domain-containing protein [Anaerolineae bacterium]|jgi:hypothetical protein|nr:DUF2785 domain-containing protein [Anaerolineae bacterium]
MTQALDTAFWQAIVAADCAIPEGHSAQSLTPQLLQMIGSPDPVLRDEIAYLVFARWIVRDQHYGAAELRALIDTLTANLRYFIRDIDTDTVLLRSFSALILSLIAYYDVQAPFLTVEELQSLLDHALTYLAEERDLRGYVDGIAWIHATAHTADLLKFLARNPKTGEAEHLRILNAIADKLLGPWRYVYVHDEDERLVMVVHDLLKRETLHHVVIIGWLERLREWKGAIPLGGPFDPAIHAPYMNTKNFVRSLYLMLQLWASLDERYADLERETLKVTRAFSAAVVYQT